MGFIIILILNMKKLRWREVLCNLLKVTQLLIATSGIKIQVVYTQKAMKLSPWLKINFQTRDRKFPTVIHFFKKRFILLLFILRILYKKHLLKSIKKDRVKNFTVR